MVKKPLFLMVAMLALVVGGTAAYASGNYYARPYDPTAEPEDWLGDPSLIRNGILMGDGNSFGIYECYRGENDYYGWVFFVDGSREPHFWLDGRGSCVEGIADPSMDIGSARDDVKIWTGNGTSYSYKWNFLSDGTLVPFTNGTGQIGLPNPSAPFKNPTIYAQDYLVGGATQWSLLTKIAELEARIEALETQ